MSDAVRRWAWTAARVYAGASGLAVLLLVWAVPDYPLFPVAGPAGLLAGAALAAFGALRDAPGRAGLLSGAALLPVLAAFLAGVALMAPGVLPGVPAVPRSVAVTRLGVLAAVSALGVVVGAFAAAAAE